jgi:hypothetical protein
MSETVKSQFENKQTVICIKSQFFTTKSRVNLNKNQKLTNLLIPLPQNTYVTVHGRKMIQHSSLRVMRGRNMASALALNHQQRLTPPQLLN